MAEGKAKETFNCTAEEFFKVVADYEKYPEFLPEIKSVKILKNDGGKKQMEYSVSMIKTFKYKIESEEVAPSKVEFKFTEGDVFKTMKGLWTIKPAGDKCEVEYHLTATFGLFMPSTIEKTLVTVSLPQMMINFKNRIKKVYGK